MQLTIADIARLANVSKATVSNVLNNKPGISPGTRQRVLALVDRYDFKPSHFARFLATRQTKSIGLIIKEIENPFFAKIIKGVFDECATAGYTVLLASSELAPEKERTGIETLLRYRVDGLILSPLQGEEIDYSYLANLQRIHLPLVMLNAVHNYSTHVVDIDNVRAAYEAASYLIELGHRRIAYLGGPSNSAHSQDRQLGYQQALIDHQIPLHREFQITAGSYIENGHEQGHKIFSQAGDAPSAVLCYNDLVAIGLVNALLEMGIPVPGSVSIIGFDDIEYCRSFKIPLTTISVPAYDIGTTAAAMVIRQIEQPQRDSLERILLQPKLMKRDSCAAFVSA